ncbi:hypothetical protein [Methylobacillus sp.]|uniref:hypothetical protein n=1 Tax=Methylobacillus sp. TaxID=56818 RepID=UPI0012BE6080|nr:hypothetical protein [Methylobacillus sp.]MPS48488.1 hypothetical protein [Methylobacillus sp.]
MAVQEFITNPTLLPIAISHGIVAVFGIFVGFLVSKACFIESQKRANNPDFNKLRVRSGDGYTRPLTMAEIAQALAEAFPTRKHVDESDKTEREPTGGPLRSVTLKQGDVTINDQRVGKFKSLQMEAMPNNSYQGSDDSYDRISSGGASGSFDSDSSSSSSSSSSD